MFSLFQLFGRSREIKALDHAFREAGIHPRTVPDAVKFTVVRFRKQEAHDHLHAAAPAVDDDVRLLAYCMLGRDEFVASNGTRAADRVEDQLEAAIVTGDSLDAKLVLLALHSGMIADDVSDRFALAAES